MTVISENGNVYPEEIYEIQTNDPLLGGPDGPLNRAAKALANRTGWLKSQLDKRFETIDAARIKTGILDPAIIPDLPASKIATGTFEEQRIPNLPATKIVTGTFEEQRIPNLDASKTNRGIFHKDRIPNSVCPVGTILWFASDDPPGGWLECDGTWLSKAAYAALYAVCGTRWGESGDNFRLPDLRGEFLRGWDHGRGIDDDRNLGTSQSDELSSHSHTWRFSSLASYNHYNTVDYGYESIRENMLELTKKTDSTGGVETRPRNVSLLPIVKY